MKTEDIGMAYYTALGEKNMEEVQNYLHPDVQLRGPKGEVSGKEAVTKAAAGYTEFFKILTIRIEFGSENQAVIIYEILPTKLQTASLLTFEDGLIARIELFYDSSH